MTLRFCFRCGCKVDAETELDYPWVCPYCDENLYDIETDLIDELDKERVAYGLYLHDWIKTHDEGEPVCYEEFMDNEYRDEECMSYLYDKYFTKRIWEYTSVERVELSIEEYGNIHSMTEQGGYYFDDSDSKMGMMTLYEDFDGTMWRLHYDYGDDVDEFPWKYEDYSHLMYAEHFFDIEQ